MNPINSEMKTVVRVLKNFTTSNKKPVTLKSKDISLENEGYTRSLDFERDKVKDKITTLLFSAGNLKPSFSSRFRSFLSHSGGNLRIVLLIVRLTEIFTKILVILEN